MEITDEDVRVDHSNTVQSVRLNVSVYQRIIIEIESFIGFTVIVMYMYQDHLTITLNI